MEIEQIPLWTIKPSRWQPRDTKFDEEKLLELANSIRDNGLINPVRVFSYDDADGYIVWELIAGERRTRACVAIALAEIFPQHALDDWTRRMAHVGLNGMGDEERNALRQTNAHIAATLDPGDMASRHLVAVIENLDRDDLSPLEEGRAYQGLIDAYHWSQRELAARVNKSQGYVAQRLALLTLPAATQDAVNTRVLSLTHARAIAAVPEPMQAAVTAWAVKAVQANDAPATSRQVENRMRQVAAFVDPDRWLPNGETVYTPTQRNRLALIRQMVENLVLTEERADAIMQLADVGYARSNLLNHSPVKIVDNGDQTYQVMKALTGLGRPVGEWMTTVHSCSSCIWGDIYKQFDGDSGFSYMPCYNIGRQKPIGACEQHIGVSDPVVIPLQDWLMQKETEGHQETMTVIQEPFLHLTSIEDFLTIYRDARADKAAREATDEQRKSRKHVEKIREYYEWQQAMPQEWRDHFQAHACEKCKFYAPLLAEAGDPPCRLVVDPLTRREYGGTATVAPDFGCLIQQSGQLAPRCEGFAYREMPGIAFPDHMHIQLPRGDRMLSWIEAIAARAKTNYSNHVLWGALSWLDYGRKIGNSEVDWKALSRWISVHWDEIGDASLAHLVDVIISETELMTKTDKHAIELLDADSMNRDTWRRLNFPFDRYREWSYMTHGWPEDWPRPWEITESDKEENDDEDEAEV